MRLTSTLTSILYAVCVAHAAPADEREDQARFGRHTHGNAFDTGNSKIVDRKADIPPPPAPEPITITELPFPPVTADEGVGGCTLEIDPCIGTSPALQNGDFLPDDLHVVATVNFTGAPASPNPASIYSGQQLLVFKIDNSTFPNGDAWQCITCGVPAENQPGRVVNHDYPQIFNDGKRLLAGPQIIECSAELVTEACTPDQVHIYPIRWNTAVNGSGIGSTIRELRIHPDNEHLGFNSFTVTSGKVSQFAYIGRLVLNKAPASVEPLVPRYDLVNVNLLFSLSDTQPIEIDSEDRTLLRINYDAITVGEPRGFSGTGKEVTYIGYPAESSNIDVFAADLATGKIRRLTAHPEYTDPVDISPDDQWTVAMDTRGSGRQMFMAGLRGIPPLTDLVATSAASSTRNNQGRRFFQPWLIDGHASRTAACRASERHHSLGDAIRAWIPRPRETIPDERKLHPQGQVAVEYHDFSDDGTDVLVGSEKVTSVNLSPTVEEISWYSDLVQTGPNNGTKKSSPDGFRLSNDILTNIFQANGTLTTTIDGKEWLQPANGT
ncbi:saponin hydrolase [Colletotrichum salicis]|uniref:Saponin hydrolase n=1 Tax=Colletotrichum salicis TaxID=1209931 RepID=A0A135UUT6_9PEZI|nr:saponin hydrolase [Colletotrichum salicis]